MCHEPEAFLGRRERSFLRCRASRAKNEETRPVGIPASRSDSRFLELILELNFPYRFPRLRGCANLRNIRTIKINSLGCQFKISPSVREAFSGRRRERRSATQEFETKKRDCWHTPPKLFSEFFPSVVILVRASSLLRAHRTTAVAWSPRKRSRIDGSIRSIGPRIALRRNSRGGTRHARLARRVRVPLAFLLNV